MILKWEAKDIRGGLRLAARDGVQFIVSYAPSKVGPHNVYRIVDLRDGAAIRPASSTAEGLSAQLNHLQLFPVEFAKFFGVELKP